LKTLLEQSIDLTNLFKGDPDALWITLPLLQLVSEILYTLSFYLVPSQEQKNPTPMPAHSAGATGSVTNKLNPSTSSSSFATPEGETPILLSPFIQISAPEDPLAAGLDGEYVEFLLGDGTESWNQWAHTTATNTWILCSFTKSFALSGTSPLPSSFYLSISCHFTCSSPLLLTSEYRLRSAGGSENSDPAIFVLKGLDANGRWTELHRVTECPFSERNEWKSFDLRGCRDVYRGVKLEIETVRQPGDGVHLGHFHLYGYQPLALQQQLSSSSSQSEFGESQHPLMSPNPKKGSNKGRGGGKSRLAKALAFTAPGIPSSSSSTKITPTAIQLNQTEKDELMKLLNECEIQLSGSGSGSGSTIIHLLVLDGLNSLKTMMVDHKKQIIGAVGTTVKGAVKSIIMREINDDLITGVCRCVSAGYDVYRHLNSETQFQMIQQVKYSLRHLTDPVWITYDQLLHSSKAMESVNGNWSLSCNYITHLTQSSLLAIKSFPCNPKESLRLLAASIHGDGCVIGIEKMLRKVIRSRTPSKSHTNIITSTLLDGETLSITLRQVLMEALGELLESVENVNLQEVDEIMKLLEEKEEEKKDQQSQQENGTKDPFEEKQIDLRKMLKTMERMEEWKQRYEKSIDKVRKHLIGALKLLEALSEYLSLFHSSLDEREGTEDRMRELDIRLRYLLSSSSFIPLTYRGIQQALLSFPENGSGSRLPGPLRNEIDQILVMKELLMKKLETVSSMIENMSSLFCDISFPLSQLETYVTHKEQQTGPGGAEAGAAGNNSSSSFRRGIGFFSRLIKTTPDPMNLLSILQRNLPKYLFAFTQIMEQISSTHSHILRFGIELISRIEDLFYDSVQQHPSELEQTRFFKPNVEGKIRNVVRKVVGKLMTELKNSCENNYGWWNSISDVWNACGFTDAMGTLRNVLPTLVGPGQFPERVEEFALVSFLELEEMIHSLWQAVTSSMDDDEEEEEEKKVMDDDDARVVRNHRSNGGRGIGNSYQTELFHLLELMRSHLSQAKATSSSSNIQLLLAQDSYREKVKYSIQETWQLIEEDVVLLHLEAFHSQECLRDKIESCYQENALASQPGLIDVVEVALNDSSSLERIEMTKEACNDLLTGQSGLSGLSSDLFIKLSHLKSHFQASRFRTLDVVVRSDRRWGIPPSSSSISAHSELGSSYDSQLPPHQDPKVAEGTAPGLFPAVFDSGIKYPSQQLPPTPPQIHYHNHEGQGEGMVDCPICQCKTCPSCHYSISMKHNAAHGDGTIPIPDDNGEESDSKVGPNWERIFELSKPKLRKDEPPTPLLYQEFGKTNGSLNPSFSKANRFIEPSKEVKLFSRLTSPLTSDFLSLSSRSKQDSQRNELSIPSWPMEKSDWDL
jgi:hypothetical protein